MKTRKVSRALMGAATSVAMMLGSGAVGASTVVYSVPLAGAFAGLNEVRDLSRVYWISAFTLQQSAQLLGAITYVGGGADTATGNGTGLDNWSGTILYRFYADNNGRPDAVIAEGSGNVQSLLPTSNVFGVGLSNPLFRLQFEFESLLDVAAGQKTWLGLSMVSSLPEPLPTVNDPGYDASRLVIADGAGDAGLTFQVRTSSTVTSAMPIPYSFAFALYAADTKPGEELTVVPVPAGLPLLVGGLGLMAAVTMRRRSDGVRVPPKA